MKEQRRKVDWIKPGMSQSRCGVEGGLDRLGNRALTAGFRHRSRYHVYTVNRIICVERVTELAEIYARDRHARRCFHSMFI